MSSSKPPTITLRKRKYTHSLNENWTYEYVYNCDGEIIRIYDNRKIIEKRDNWRIKSACSYTMYERGDI